jgi:putative transcriptional regulator
MRVNKETMIAIPADPDDPEDFDVSVAGMERAHMWRRTRRLRHRLGMSQEAFARTYGIPLANIRQYEIGRHMPPPAVRPI